MVVGLRLYGLLLVASLAAAGLWRCLGFPVCPPQTFEILTYQRLWGGLDGRSCPSYPVCSLYARQAMGRYGLVLGSWLMLDRLIHESDDLRRGPWIVWRGERRLYDPLKRNTRWDNREER